MNKRIPLYLPMILFAITTFTFFYDQIVGNAFFWEDFVEYVYPVQSFAASEGGLFSIPFWNPYIFGGMPFFADLQVGFLYPLNRILSLFVDSNGQLPVSVLQVQIILHFFIAQISMFFLLRYLKISYIGAIISSISFAFSYILVYHIIHPMMIYHLSWFPLVIMFTIKSIDKLSLKSGIIAGLILGLTMLSGHPQTTVYQYLFIGILIVFKLIEKVKSSEKTELIKLILAPLFVFVFSLGLFFVQYLPSKDLADNSQREEITYEKSAEGSLEFKQIITSVVPSFFGEVSSDGKSDIQWHLASKGKNIPYYHYWDTGFYFGLTALILGLFGAFYQYKTYLGKFLILMIVFGFLYSLGDNGFLHKMFYSLPFFNSLRMPARMMFYVVIGFSIFSGYGFDKLLSKDKNIKKLIFASAIPLLFALLAAGGVLQDLYDTPNQLKDAVNEKSVNALLFLFLIIGIIFIGYFKILHYYVIAILLGLITFFDLYFSGVEFNKSSKNPEDVYKLPAQIESAFSVNPPEKIFRVKSRSYKPRYMAFQRNQGMISKMMLMEGYNPLLLKKIYPSTSTSEKSYDMLNIDYVIDVNLRTNQPYFKEFTDDNGHLWMAYKKVVHKAENMKNYINESDIDFSNTIVIEEDDGFELNDFNDSTKIEYKAEIVSYDNNEISIEVNTPKKGYLVLSEVWYPDWKAEVNGNEKEILRVNNSLRAVQLEKGENKIEMYYESDSFKLGRLIAIITLMLGIIGIVVLKDKESTN